VADESGRQRRDADHQQAGHEDPPSAEQVSRSAAEQQEAAEGDQIGVHDPGKVLLREVKALPDARQGDVDD